MEAILNLYYANNAQKLHGMVDRLLVNLGIGSLVDHEDFYSLANEVFVEVMRRYDEGKPFDVFLYSCLSNRFKAEMTKRNRYKRQTESMLVSLEAPVGDGDGTLLIDMIADDDTVESEVLGSRNTGYSRRMTRYLDKLSRRQRDVLHLSAEGYAPAEIRERLQLSRREYADCNAAIHSYRNVSVLF